MLLWSIQRYSLSKFSGPFQESCDELRAIHELFTIENDKNKKINKKELKFRTVSMLLTFNSTGSITNFYYFEG